MIVLVHGAHAFGAVERYAASLVEGLKADGATATLLLSSDPSVDELAAVAGGTVAAERYPANLLAASGARVTFDLAGRLRRLRPDVVHLIDTWGAAAVAARVAGVRRLLVTHHTPQLPRHESLAGRIWTRLGWLMRPTVLYTSETDRQADRRRPARVVELGIDLERFASAGAALSHQGPVVGNVARLAEQKGHATLVDAVPLVLQRRPDALFVIVGEGELRDDLEARVRGAGVERAVSFTGARGDVPELLKSFDVFAFPSLYEGLCLAVIEAQAAGVPVVATPVGGIRETVLDGVSGLLVPPGDPRALADAILRLLEDRDLAARLAAEAARRVTRFSEREMVERTLALYR